MNAVTLSGGRGWLDAAAAASIARIDAQHGRPVQITEAGRSREDADKNRAAWLAYKAGTGPKAPYALGADESVHCQGEAVDSDDHGAPWEVNGWIQTARYPDDRDEPWHREYFPERDRHRNDPTAPAVTTPLEDTMKLIRWNEQHVFAVGPEAVYHVPDPKTLQKLTPLLGPYTDVDNDGLTAVILAHGLMWDAFDAVLRGVGPGGGGKYWSRLTAEGIAIRSGQTAAAKTLADVLAAARALVKPV